MLSPSVPSSRSSLFTVSRLSVRHLAVACLVALFGICQGFAQVPSAPQSRPAEAASAPAAAEEQETAPSKDDASHQGIKVHGHWKIVVKNPDGSVAHSHEFENSLAPSGGFVLAAFLANGAASGGLEIELSTTGNSICPTGLCEIVPSTSTGIGALYCGGSKTSSFVTCTAGMTTTLVNSTSAVNLSGQLTATQAGTITKVATQVLQCGSQTTSAACTATTTSSSGSYEYLTTTTVSPIAVNAGQIVQVSVTISFS